MVCVRECTIQFKVIEYHYSTIENIVTVFNLVLQQTHNYPLTLKKKLQGCFCFVVLFVLFFFAEPLGS